jgi:hypothetical protein
VWFRDYKMPDGKPQNAFGYDNKCLDKDFTMKVGHRGRCELRGAAVARCWVLTHAQTRVAAIAAPRPGSARAAPLRAQRQLCSCLAPGCGCALLLQQAWAARLPEAPRPRGLTGRLLRLFVVGAQVIEETHAMYVALKSGKRANSEELSLI